MENLSGYTETELLKMINDCKAMHDTLKQEIIDMTYEVDVLEQKINARIDVLNKKEKEYVKLIEELNNRQNVV
jgi:septal ring factor EnvC (AmiA/AmiB activator)